MKCHATSFLNNLNVSEVQNCVKCVELEIQLQKVLKELNSVQLVIQMLKRSVFKRIPLQHQSNRWKPNWKWMIVGKG